MAGKNGKAAVFVDAQQPLEIREYPVLEPAENDVLLRLDYSGICGTDIHIIDGRLNIPPAFIPGHEFIGTIEEIGKNAKNDGLGNTLKIGDKVIACVALPCGYCFSCRNGNTASCLNFGVSNIRDPESSPHFFGGFADYLQQPAATCIRIPEDISLEAVASLPCAGPTSIRAFEVMGGITQRELVVVQGTGPVGLFAIAWAAKAGAKVIAIGSSSSPERMKMAEEFGASKVIDYRQSTEEQRLQKIAEIAAELGRGNGADVVFEASGSPSAIPEGMNLTRTLGRYLVPGQYSASGKIEIQPELITFKALKIIGSGQYKLADIAAYLDFLKRNSDFQNSFAKSITHKFTVMQANEAVGCVREGKAVKAVFANE